MNILEGFCSCGCGKRTKIAQHNVLKWGWIKGQFRKYLPGHHMKRMPFLRERHPNWNNGRMVSNGYILILMPNHPRANKGGYIGEHILIAEKILGKFLPGKACIHHVNGIANDNRPENLVICQDNGYHLTLHRRERALRICGYADWRLCTYCKKYDELKNLYDHGHSQFRHKQCHSRYEVNRRSEQRKLKRIKY